ncbi:Leucine-, isoleucine-, valine-, threonine-, and alanine-binding protein precursor [Aerococcus viridans]|uniref:Branched-chain amino acid ABC transporter substrate-binding protein n=2 Tax=Aerococcus viridans TaxID=1377 RepID=A0AAU8U652_9LACT|nr:ABC transporter substrate-binding protein [Aerococcus viridans]AMC01696.1 branched-chain amino acid ABC transporter substrate-binding protein [Aerococcus viridans]EFG50288.1 receptor family ligand-binding protein [Aerococcus viridans ATCC 11563 = CCUG 4311]SUU13189.1 Leucine-, isoleucine-, valine-, threonine-, and alanine-binding protein precursor [Aerococcus viridans]
MKFKKLALTLLSTVTLAACGAATSTSNSGATNTAGNETFNVGGNFGLSGAFSAYGTAINDGAALAFKEINEDGGVLGKDVNYISVDNKSDATESTTQTARLIDEENISVLVGSDTTGSTEAQIQTATDASVPIVAPAATGDSLTLDSSGNVLDYVFRVPFQDAFQGSVLAEFANQEGYETAAIIQDNSSDYGQNLAAEFDDIFEGEVVGTESYVSGDTDFNSILNNIASKNPDVIFIAGYYTEGGSIVKQAREMGIESAILAPDGFGAEEFVELAGAENVNNFYYTAHYTTGEGATDKTTAFVEAFEAEYGSTPNMFAALGYDAAYLVADAAGRAGEDDRQAITDALAETTDFEGVTGTFSFDENHNPVKTAYIIEMANGEEVGSSAVSPEDVAN